MGKKLFVGGLSWGTNDVTLREAFEPHGTLSEVKVVIERDTGRSRRFGFVTFEDESAADAALAAMNGVTLDGRNIRVDNSAARPDSGVPRREDAGGDRPPRAPRRDYGNPEVIRRTR